MSLTDLVRVMELFLAVYRLVKAVLSFFDTPQ